MAMSDHVEMLLKQALALPVAERAALIEKLIGSLGQPDPVTDARFSSKDRPEESRLVSDGVLDNSFLLTRDTFLEAL